MFFISTRVLLAPWMSAVIIKTIHNNLGELSTDEVVEMLSQISEADEFPDLVIDWFDLIENYLEVRHQSE